MKKVYLCTRMPHGTSYVGGVVTIVSQYLASKKNFYQHGFDIDIFDYQNERIGRIKNSKVQNILYAYFQRKDLAKLLGRNFDGIIHIHSSRGWLLLKDLLLCKYVKSKTKAKIIVTIHFADADNIFYKNKFIRNLEINLVNQFVDKVVLLSRKTMDEFVNLGIDFNKLTVSYTFHNFENPQMTDTSLPISLLFVGSIDKRKGILDLLKVLVELQSSFSFILNICGKITENDIENDYKELILKLGDRVIERGYVTGIEKQRIFEDADILVLPSYGEGMPIVIMEGIATGTAIISTKVGAIPEIVTEKNGILHTPGDAEALKSALINLMGDKELLNSIKLNNYRTGSQYSLNHSISEMCSYYSEL